MGKKQHWTESLAEELKAELSQMAEAGRLVFADLRPPERKPSRQQRVTEFLQMTREQRQQLYANMGPEEYARFLDDNMNDLVNTIGPAASKVLPYLYADGIPQQDFQSAEQEAQNFLSKIADGQFAEELEQELINE